VQWTGQVVQSLDITGADNGTDLLARRSAALSNAPSGAVSRAASRPLAAVRLLDDGTPPPERPAQGTRIGIRVAKDEPWRFWVAGDENVSR